MTQKSWQQDEEMKQRLAKKKSLDAEWQQKEEEEPVKRRRHDSESD
jgi:hypothetical protein